MRRVFIVLTISLFALQSFGQNVQSLGAKNTVIKISGMLMQDSISSVFANLDTATVRAAFPTQRMFGRVGFVNGLPYIFNGTNWIRMYGVDTSGLSNRIDDKIDGSGTSGYVPVFSGSKTIIQSPLQVNDASISYPDAFDLNRETGIYKLGDIDDHANRTKVIFNDNNRSITVDADSLIADDIYNSTGEKYITNNSIEDAIVNNVTDKAPSQNIVSDSLSVLQTRKLNKADSSTAYFTPRQIDSLFNTIQTITSDITATVTNGVKWLIVNPPGTAASITVTAPPSPRTGDILQISFGGTITSGTVVTSFTFSPNTGQSVLQASTPSLVEAGETITYRFYNSKWYRL